jgi:cell division septal protein FtsQ
MKLFGKKNKFKFKSLMVQRYRQGHEMRKQRKKFKVSKMFLRNIKTKFLEEYKYVIFGVILIILLGGSIGLIFFSNFFSVSSIIVERTDPKTDIETSIIPMQQKLDVLTGKNIFLINEDEIEYTIRKDFPEMKEINIMKLYPRTLKVRVIEYDLVARIKSSTGKDEMLLNERGMIRNMKTKMLNLPLIEYKSQYDIKEDKMVAMLSPYLALQDRNAIMNGEEVRTILDAKNTFEQNFSLKVTLIQYYPLEREIHLINEKGFTLWLDLTENIDEQLNKLKTAFQDFNIYKIELSYIDLRINNKIIYCTKNSICVSNNKQ